MFNLNEKIMAIVQENRAGIVQPKVVTTDYGAQKVNVSKVYEPVVEATEQEKAEEPVQEDASEKKEEKPARKGGRPRKK